MNSNLAVAPAIPRRKAAIVVSSFLVVLLGWLLLPAASTSASMSASNIGTLHAAVQQQSTNSVNIGPGGTATFTARGFCIDFGKPFPDQAMTTNGLADDKIRAALNYSIQKGYTEGSPDQVELAIWFLRDNTWHNAQHATAQEIVTNATAATAPASSGDGITLSDAITQNKVTITAKFVAQTAGHFYGDTTIEVKNSGTSDLKVFVPIGTLFTVPGANGKFQDLAAYLLAVQSQQPTAVPTVEPTTTPQPTQEPTQQPATAVATAATEAPTQVSGTLPQSGQPAGVEQFVPSSILIALGAILFGVWLVSGFGKRRGQL